MKEPVLKMDALAKRLVVKRIKDPARDNYALDNSSFANLMPADTSNVKIDRLPSVGRLPNG